MQSNFTKLDMHTHSNHSKDSDLKLHVIAQFLDRNTDYGIILSDHNEISGATELNQEYPDRVIIGEEIRTDSGEVTGIFLKEKIQPLQSISWTLDAIIAQGGLVYIPHPLDRLRTSKLTADALDVAVQKVDIIEVYNSRNVYPADDRKALALAKDKDIIMGCGSDAHTRFELGRSYVNIDTPFELTPDGLLGALNQATRTCRRSFIGVHFITKAKKLHVKHIRK
ncbi:MAG: PHP domain-containing protein [Clostridiales bacterium]|nr:PHP domain-containing protein [Clostridiales bacterium]